MTSHLISTPLFNEYDYIGINGVSINQLEHPHFDEWFRYIVTSYEPPHSKIGLFIPCSVIKPYFNSPIHKVINKAIIQYENYIHKIVISNAGIIPYEFAGYYPFNSYDWNPRLETEEIKNKYIELTANRLIEYLNKHSSKYKYFLTYYRLDAEELIALEVASQVLGISMYHIDVNIKDCDTYLSNTSDIDLVLTLDHNINKLKSSIEMLINQ